MVAHRDTPELPILTPAQFAAAVDRAVELLRAGELVALPTETVYGLAAHALRPEAVAAIFRVKGRPAHNPIIMHVASLEMARACASQWPAAAGLLAQAFWPGPLTLVLPRAPHIPDAVTAGGPTVGVRWPNHPFMQAVIQACGFPLAAPSANLSNRVSPTTAAHVRRQLGGKIPLIVDGGPCPIGIESTVVSLTGGTWQILRPGMIHEASLAAVLGPPDRPAADTTPGLPPASPGCLPRHYAPKGRLLLLSWSSEASLREQLRRWQADPGQTCVIAHTAPPSRAGWREVSLVPHDPPAFARALYAELHRADDLAAQWIVVEKTPATGPWRAIADRLQRAGGGAAA